MENQNKKKQSFRQVCSNQWFMIKLCFKATPFFMCFMMFEAIKLQVFIFLEHTVGIQYVLHTAETGGPFFNAFLYLVVIAGGIELSAMCSAIFIHYVSERQKPRLYKALKEQLYVKAKELDLSCYDDPKYYNEFVLVVSESEKSLDRFLTLVSQVCSGITILISSGLFIFFQDKWGLFFVTVSFLLSYFFAQAQNKLNFKVRLLRNPIERKRDYNHRVFYLSEYAKELRLNPSVKELLYDNFNQTNDEIYDITKKYTKKLRWLGFFKNYLSRDFITDGLYSIYLVFRTVVMKAISYSSMVVLFNTINRCRRSMNMLADAFPMATETVSILKKSKHFYPMKLR